MKKFINILDLIITTAIITLAIGSITMSNANAGVLWDSSFADCLDSRVKPNSTSQHAAAARGYCREKFPETPGPSLRSFSGKLDGKTCESSYPNDLQSQITCSYVTRNDK